jgi:hypothetical protein
MICWLSLEDSWRAIPRPKALGGYRGIAGGIRITLLARVKVFKTPPGL